MDIAKGNSRPEQRESRPAYKAGRLPICKLGGYEGSNSISALRVQFLTDKLGLPDDSANLLAGFVWGVRHYD